MEQVTDDMRMTAKGYALVYLGQNEEAKRGLAPGGPESLRAWNEVLGYLEMNPTLVEQWQREHGANLTSEASKARLISMFAVATEA